MSPPSPPDDTVGIDDTVGTGAEARRGSGAGRRAGDTRTKARKRALDVLYAADLRGESPADALARTVAESRSETAAESGPEADQGGELNPYVGTVVRLVGRRQEPIDAILARYAQSWTLDRMPAVDRNLLRIGTAEILFSTDIPDEVAISAAVDLAASLSTDDSPAFVNGVLGSVMRDKEALLVEFA
ncbi:MAG: transcription antitermination factor NusB [Nocardioides sp.]